MSRRSDLRAAGAGILLVASVLGASLGHGVAASAAEPPSTQGLSYVALGDSYAAGYGLADLTKKPVAACAQSGRDYPHRVAAALGLVLTDVSCAGATTADVVSHRQLGAAPQIDALSPRTKLVTISIGGNDAGLFETASSCIALSKTGPIFGAASSVTNCRSEYVKHGRDTLSRAIETTTAAGLKSAFAAIHHRAPHAAVVVVGYPAIFPDSAHTPKAGCYRSVVDSASLADGFPRDGFPFTATDVAYLSGVQATLDRVTRTAADTAGFTYVSTVAASEAHSGCATTGSYISGITLTATEYFKSISLAKGALHPNSRGVAFLAAQAASGITAALTPTASPTPTPTPTASGVTAGSGSATLPWIGLVAILAIVAVGILLARRRRPRPRR